MEKEEGLEEAYQDNLYAQQMYALLCLPQVYESLGLSGPPLSFTPPDLELYANSLRFIET